MTTVIRFDAQRGKWVVVDETGAPLAFASHKWALIRHFPDAVVEDE